MSNQIKEWILDRFESLFGSETTDNEDPEKQDQENRPTQEDHPDHSDERVFGTEDTPEPLEYHQPDHPDVVNPTNTRAWRRPLLSPSECDHDRTFTEYMEGLGGGAEITQYLDCSETVEIKDEQNSRDHQPRQKEATNGRQ